jgi:VWFA-related protein
MSLRRLLLGSAVFVVPATLLAQQPATFRAEANYVEVDVVVTDSAGRFVTGLTATDFDVRELRQPQRISSFAMVELPMTPGATAASPAPVLFRPDMPQSERLDADRIYLLYLNGGGLEIRKRAEEFVRDFMLPDDIGAVWNTETMGRAITFTNDKATLLREIGPLTGAINEPPSSFRERSLQEGRRLRDAIDWLTSIQGRRKSLLLFTEGWPVTEVRRGPDGRPQREREVTEWLQGRGPGVVPGGTWLNPTDITDRSDVHVYTYDVRGLVAVTPPPSTARIAVDSTSTSAAAMAAAVYSQAFANESTSATVMRSIADQTGGLAFVESNDFRRGFARIVEDNSRYYLLGYHSPRKERDGVFRSISVRVNRPGMRVRARDGYVAR